MENLIKRKRTQTTHSAKRVASSENLLTKILLRLPVRSLIRFKTTSKHWLSLITSPHFCLLHYHPTPPSGLFLNTTPSNQRAEYEYIPFDGEKPSNPPFRALAFARDSHGIRIIQSCNGLLFCCSCRWPARCRKYYVYNPTTKQHTTIPPLPGNRQKFKIHAMVLAFDPSRSPHYKVICVRDSEQVSESRDLYQIVIYSSEAGIWRVSGQPFTAVAMNFQSGVYLNGAVYWISDNCVTHYFKIDEERLETMPMPMEEIPYGWMIWPTCSNYFAESRGHLHFIYCSSTKFDVFELEKFDVFELEKNNSRWFVKYQVDLNEIISLFSGPSRIYNFTEDWKSSKVELIRIVRGEREEDSFLVLELGGKLFKYNLVEKSYKKLYDIPTGQRFFGGYVLTKAFEFIESLSSV